MFKTNQALAFFSCLCFLLFFANDTSAQDQITQPDFGNGSFEEVADNMEKLLQLQWKGNTIALNRDWAERKKPDDDKDELEEVVERFIQRGLPEERARQIAEIQLRGRNFGGRGLEQSEIGRAFFAISSTQGRVSGGSSGAGEQQQLHFSTNSLIATAVIANQDFRFAFEEVESPGRNFEFRDEGNGNVQFAFSHEELFLRFRQTGKGTVQLIWIRGDEADVYLAANYSEFLQEHPQPANKLLLPLLERLGIKMPISRTDPRVLSAALILLERMQVDDDEQVTKLFKDLESRSSKTRRNATEKLAEGYEDWAGQIEKQLNDSSLSLEAKNRLKKIVENSNKSEIALFMEEHRSLETPSFLVKLLEFAENEQKLLVVEQLKKVTGEDNGESLDAWKAWLVESSEE